MKRYITAGLVSMAVCGAHGVAASAPATASGTCPQPTVLWPSPTAPAVDPNAEMFDVNDNYTGDTLTRGADGIVRAQDSRSGATWVAGDTSAHTAVVRGDFNGDRTADLLARTSTGLLEVFAGSRCTAGPMQAPVRVAATSGWNQFSRLVSPGDLDRDGANDLLAQWPDGDLFLYRGKAEVTGTATAPGLHPAIRIAGGWNRFRHVVPLGDVTQDGVPDLLGVDSVTGHGLLYAGNPAGRYDYKGTAVASLHAAAVTAVGDVNRDGRPDLLVRRAAADASMRMFSADYGPLPTYSDTGTVVPAAAVGSSL